MPDFVLKHGCKIVTTMSLPWATDWTEKWNEENQQVQGDKWGENWTVQEEEASISK